jgi:carbamoyltransferase
MEIKFTNPDKDLFFSMKNRLKAVRFDGIAAGLQYFCEDISKQWVKNCIQETGLSSVVISGGVAMNIKINKVIMELPEVEEIFVGPSGGDESLSAGAAYALWHDLYPQIPLKPLENTYLGPAYGKQESEKAISEMFSDGFNIVEDPPDGQVARMLARGRVIARAVGRMEYGARSLGNRSILANASDYRTIRKINDQIKRRDFWMPFAPIILAERMKDYVVNPKNILSPFMTMGFDSTELAKQHLRAGLHPADDSMRPQILQQSDNPRLHALLLAYEKETGMGGLLNTSLNLHGEPICCTPQDSMKTFLNSGLDGLLLEGFLITRNEI